jgi:hemolysin D
MRSAAAQCVCVTQGKAVFPARVELSQFSINVNGRLTPLTAGLAATAEIKTGRRRIIEFLLSPLQRRVEEAGRER